MKYKNYISTFTIPTSILFTNNLYSKNPYDTSQLEITPIDEIHEAFAGSKVSILDVLTQDVIKNQYYNDGTLKSRRKTKTWFGVWFIDGKGHLCIKWNNKDKSECGKIMKDKDNN